MPLPRQVPFLDVFGSLEAVVCTTHFPPRIEENGETVDVLASGKKLTLLAKALPSLRLLLSGRPVPLDRAVSVVGSEAVEVAEILVKDELCAVLTSRVVLGLHRSRHERRLLTGALDLGVTSVRHERQLPRFPLAHRPGADGRRSSAQAHGLHEGVGYFPGRERAEHSLDPVRLYEAVEHAVRDLGREPGLVFLRNPEQSLGDASAHGRDTLAQACAALDDATSKGLSGAWGMASWDPSPLVGLVDPTTPKPSVLMARAGLLVGTRTLEAAEALAAAWDLDRSRLWGMSPFGGNTGNSVWGRIDPRVFLQGGDGFSRAQAAFRASYCLPGVGTMAVGTDDPAHLGELLDSLAAEPNERTIHEYRALLRERSTGQPT